MLTLATLVQYVIMNSLCVQYIALSTPQTLLAYSITLKQLQSSGYQIVTATSIFYETWVQLDNYNTYILC